MTDVRLGGEFTPGLYHAELASGNYIDLAAPDARSIQFMDIAYGLSNLCRYNGQTGKTFYSVAEHAVLTAWRLERLRYDVDVVLAGLHHDDAEGLTGDITRPVKKLLDDAFSPVEIAAMDATVQALGLDDLPFEHPAVKDADNWALLREAYMLMPSRGKYWHPHLNGVEVGPAPWKLGWSPRKARRRWIRTHYRLAAAWREGALAA